MGDKDQMLEVGGYIKKRETLSTIDNNILPNTWVLESVKPFPGYHGKNLPDEAEPRSLFLMVSNEYSFEEIARIARSLHNSYDYSFNATVGTIYFQPYTYHCIRLKYLSSFTYIPQLQEFFGRHGVKFLKKRELERDALIRIQKVFWLWEQEPSIYRDMNNQVKYYFELPEKVEWEYFRRFTHNIKNNMVDNNFDAAVGVFYRKKHIVDMVRIYDRDRSLGKMKSLKALYEEEIRKSYK